MTDTWTDLKQYPVLPAQCN